MLTREEIKEKSNTIAKASLPQFEENGIHEDDCINADGGLDSMTVTYIICSIEEELDITIPQKKWKKLTTLGALLDACEAELAKKK